MDENEIKTPENQNLVQANKLSMPMAIVVAGIFIAGAIFFGMRSNNDFATNNGTQPQATKQKPTSQSVDISKVKIKGEPFVGNPKALVTMAYWFDYQCPFCKRFDEDTITKLMKNYVNTGKVKIVFKDFQFLGPDSQTAGLAGRAVWEVAPDKFYSWHKAMYEKQDGENSGWGNKADILALTKSLGIDSVKVGQLMISKAEEYQKIIDADKIEGTSFGIKGTPGSIIGRNIISGAQPYDSVKQLIELALQGK